MHEHDRFGNLRQPLQRRFDFVDLDAMAADFDLAIAPAEEFERAVGADARAIAGPVEQRSRQRSRTDAGRNVRR